MKLRFLHIACVTIVLSLLSSCASSPPLTPTLNKKDIRNKELLVIAGMNDFHGALDPIGLSGGAENLAIHLSYLRDEFQNRLLIFDAGNQWQGNLESQILKGKPVVELFNLIGVDAAALGRYELSVGNKNNGTFRGDPQGHLRENLLSARYPYLSANLKEPKLKDTWRLPNLYSHKIIVRNGIRVGVFGLTSPKIQSRKFDAIRDKVSFSNLIESAKTTIDTLKKQKAEVIVLIANLGARCKRPAVDLEAPVKNPLETQIFTPKTPQGYCDTDSELGALLKSLPKNSIDAVVAGNDHSIVHHWIEGVPVVQSGAMGMYVQLMYLSFDLKKRKIDPSLTRIEGPISVCSKVYQGENHCLPQPYGDEEKPLVRAHIHHRPIESMPEAKDIILKAKKNTDSVRNYVLAQSDQTIDHYLRKESPLGNLLADSIRKQVDADFALVNPGAIQGKIQAGKITYQQIYHLLPYETKVVKIKLSGRQLKQILRVANSGARGFFSVSGLRLELVDLPFQARSSDLNRDRKITHWEVNRLLSVEDDQFRKIKDRKTYTLATTDYLAAGGDDLHWVMNQIPKNQFDYQTGGLVRDSLMDYLSSSPKLSIDNISESSGSGRIVLYESVRKQRQAQRQRRKLLRLQRKKQL